MLLSRDVLRAWCYALILSVGLNFSVGAAVAPFIKALAQGAESVADLMAKKGIDSAVAARQGSGIQRALIDLNGGAAVTEAAIRSRLNSFQGMNAEGVASRERLLSLFDKEASTLSRQEWTDAANSLMYLASRYGDSVDASCGSCVDTAARNNGFKYTVTSIDNPRVQQVRQALPDNPRELDKLIGDRMKSLGLGNFTFAEKRLVIPEERRALATFLAMARSGSPANATERGLIDAILGVSTGPDGVLGHSLWRLFKEQGMNQSFMTEWTQVLRETASVSKASDGQVTMKEAWLAAMEKRAKDPEGHEAVESLRRNNCYFN